MPHHPPGTSLGIGDLVPNGSLRFMAGMEALLGLVLIAWTSSFVFVQMRNFWSAPHQLLPKPGSKSRGGYRD